MNRLLTIALHEFRFAVRSRLLVAVATLVFAIVVFLPMTLKDDGTTTSRQHILITYTLGAVTWILGAASLLWAASSINRERKSGTFLLVATKPVRMSVLWWGKCLGISLTMLLIAVMATLFISLQLIRDHNGIDTTGALHPQHVTLPIEKDFEDEIDSIMTRIHAAHEEPEGVSAAELRNQVRNQLRRQSGFVAPGQTQQWTFLLESTDDLHSGIVEARFEGMSAAVRMPMTGQWSILNPQTKQVLFSTSMSNFYGGLYRMQIPIDIIPALASSFIVRFVNAGRENSATVAFPTQSPIRFLHPGGTWLSNLLICLIFLGAVLVILTAVGLFCSSCFETATAAFCSTAIVLMVLIATATTTVVNAMQPEAHHHGDAHEEGLFLHGSERVNETLARALVPITKSDMMGHLAGGIALSWSVDLAPGLITAGFISFFFFLISVLILTRQELDIIERNRTT